MKGSWPTKILSLHTFWRCKYHLILCISESNCVAALTLSVIGLATSAFFAVYFQMYKVPYQIIASGSEPTYELNLNSLHA